MPTEVTQANIDTFWKAPAPDGVYQLKGELRPTKGFKAFPGPTLLDCSQAHIVGDWRMADAANAILSDVYADGALVFTRCRDIAIRGRSRLRGPWTRGLDPTGSAISFNEGARCHVEGADLVGFKNAVVFGSVQGFSVVRVHAMRCGSDGIVIGASQNGLVDGCALMAPLALNADVHADGIQMFSTAGKPCVADITIRRTLIEGAWQGIVLTNHVRDGVDDGGGEHLTIQDVDIVSGFPNGIGLVGARNSLVERALVGTVPASTYQSRISFTGGSGNVIRASSYSAYGKGAGASWDAAGLST